MSYAANPTRSQSATGRDRASTTAKRSNGSARTSATPRRPPTGRPFDEPTDWGKILLIGATVAAGAALGAGAALLVTDKTGPQRRAGIARGARRFGHRAEHAWDDLAFELREAARTARNRFRRSRHAAAASEDEIDD